MTNSRTLKRICVFLLLAVMTTGVASAQWTSAILEPVTLGPEDSRLEYNNLTLDQLGNLHMVYVSSDGPESEIYYTCKPNGGTWLTPESVGDATLGLLAPKISVNPMSGDPYLVYMEDTRMKLAIRNENSWMYYDLPTSGFDELFNPVIAVDENGFAHVAFIVRIGEFFRMGYGYWDGPETGNFHFQCLDESFLAEFGLGASPDICVRSGGRVALSYRGNHMFIGYTIDVAENGELGGDEWQIQIASEGGIQCYCSAIEVDADDNLHLAYDGQYSIMFPWHLFYAIKEAGVADWSIPVAVDGDINGGRPALALAEDGSVHIAFEELDSSILTGNIGFTSNQSGEWIADYLLLDDKYAPSLVLDSQGNGSLIFHQSETSADYDIYYYGYVEPPGPPPELAVTLIPETNPIVMGPGGGSFSYTLEITNTGTAPAEFDGWIEVALAGGTTIGPLLLRQYLELDPGQSLTRDMTQEVPASAPGGTSTYRLNAGSYPDVVCAFDQFDIIKAIPDGEDNGSAWYHTGWSATRNRHHAVSTLDEQWDLLFTSLAGNACNDNELYGVTYAEDLFFVSGGNNYTSPNKVYVLNSDGSYFADFDQWSTSEAGWKGLTYDGTYLYGCEGNVIRAFDLTGNPVPSMDITLSMYGMEGIAHDPISDNFWAVAAGELYEIDRQGNAYYMILPYIGATGLAFDEAAPDGPWLWIFCNLGPSQTLIKQFDPQTQNLTGFMYELPLLAGSSAQTSSDLFFTAGFDPDVYVLGGLTQADPIDQIFALEMYPQSAAPGVTVALTYQSGSPIPAGGGSFDFNIAISNDDPAPVSFDIWTLATLPDGSEYGPIINVPGFTAPASWSSNRDRTQAVPASAPPGLYTYDAYVGVYPDEIWDEDHFEFEKLEEDGAVAQEGSWACWGVGFDDLSGQDASPLPAQFAVLEAYPNPFNPATTISFTLVEADFVNLAVYDLMGRQVALLVDGTRDAGRHEVAFDARNLTSGIYVYRLETSAVSVSGKLVLMK